MPSHFRGKCRDSDKASCEVFAPWYVSIWYQESESSIGFLMNMTSRVLPSSGFSHCCGNQTIARFFSDPSLPSFKEKEVCFTGGSHNCSHRGVSHVEFSQSHSKRLIFYHCCSSPSTSFAATAAARCALLACPALFASFLLRKEGGRINSGPLKPLGSATSCGNLSMMYYCKFYEELIQCRFWTLACW